MEKHSDDIRLAISKIICSPNLKLKIRRQMVEILDRLDKGQQLVGEHREIAASLLSTLNNMSLGHSAGGDHHG